MSSGARADLERRRSGGSDESGQQSDSGASKRSGTGGRVGRCHRWRDEHLEKEGDAELGWGLLGDRCGEVCALSL